MGHGPMNGPTEVAVHVTEEGRVFVQVESRFVEVSLEELDGILSRLATAEGRVVYSRDDPGEEPHAAALEVIELVLRHRLPIHLLDSPPDELSDSDL